MGVFDGYVSPELLNQFYNISNNNGSAIVSQAVLETIDNAMSPTDLTRFQQYFNLTVEPIAQDIGGHVSDDACNLCRWMLRIQFRYSIFDGYSHPSINCQNSCQFG